MLCLNRLCYRCFKTVLITRNVETSISLGKYLLLPPVASRAIKRPKKTCTTTMEALYLVQARKKQKRSSRIQEFRVYTYNHLVGPKFTLYWKDRQPVFCYLSYDSSSLNLYIPVRTSHLLYSWFAKANGPFQWVTNSHVKINGLL